MGVEAAGEEGQDDVGSEARFAFVAVLVGSLSQLGVLVTGDTQGADADAALGAGKAADRGLDALHGGLADISGGESRAGQRGACPGRGRPRHSDTRITRDVYQTVLPQVGQNAAEATAKLVPLQRKTEARKPARTAATDRQGQGQAKARAKAKNKAKRQKPEKKVAGPLRSRSRSHGIPVVRPATPQP